MEREVEERWSPRAATMMEFPASSSRLAPKRLKDSARGFNPWKQVNTTARPKGAVDICERRFVWSTFVHLRHRFYRPFRAGFFLNQHLGLKPQAAVARLWRALVIRFSEPKNLAATKALRSRAESSCPFGANLSPVTFHLSHSSA